MNEFKRIKFKDQDFEMDVNVSTIDNSAWFSQKDLALLFNTTTTNISYHINRITKEELLDTELFQNFWINYLENEEKRGRPTKYFNIEMAMIIGNRIGSKRGLLLKSFLDAAISRSFTESCDRIIIYNNGKINIPINIDLKTENAWASVNQIAKLFDTSNKNIYQHISNIFSEGEMISFNDDSVFKDSLTTDTISQENIPYQKEIYQLSEDGKYYLTKVYNLDVILAVGYRVKSVIAMRFRRWITFVLKKILTHGYYLDDERCEHCNKVLELENQVLKLKNEQLKEIRYFPGDELRGFIEIKRFLETAKKEIIIIDNYFGHEFDEVLKNLNIKKTIITNPKNIKIESNDNYQVIKKEYFHDSYILVDELCYTCGASIKDIGSHDSVARRSESLSIKEVHELIKKWKGEQ